MFNMNNLNNDFFIIVNNITKIYNNNTIAISDMSFGVKKGEFFTLLGPSGCGKSTILRIIAGLEKPQSGFLLVDNKVMFCENGIKKSDIFYNNGKVFVPPEKRGIGFVFQDYALFPHMNVYENISFGLNGFGKIEKIKRVEEMLELVGLSDRMKNYPHQLSGGEQQRVALARALASFPKVMLLDEPFSNLDEDLRFQLRTQTQKILKEKGITTILVTHDQEEAFSLSDRLGVINKGNIEQVSEPIDIYNKPTTRFVAGFIGKANFLDGIILDKNLISDIGVFSFESPSLEKTEVEIMIRPQNVDFYPDDGGEATIIETQFLGADMIYFLRLKNGTILESIKPANFLYRKGTRVKIHIDEKNLIIFPNDKSSLSLCAFQKN